MKPGFYWMRGNEAKSWEGIVEFSHGNFWKPGAEGPILLGPWTLLSGPISDPIFTDLIFWHSEMHLQIDTAATNLPQDEPQPAPTTKELADRMDALEAKLAAVFERHGERVFYERLQQSFDHEGGRG